MKQAAATAAAAAAAGGRFGGVRCRRVKKYLRPSVLLLPLMSPEASALLGHD